MRLLAIVWMSLMMAAPAIAGNVGDWNVSEFPNQGQPIGCIMGGDYQDGTRFSIIVDTQYSWAIGLSNPSWKLVTNQTTDVAVYVDGQFIEGGKASHYSDIIAVLPLTRADTYRALRAGHRLDLTTPYGKLNFALVGTARAMSEVLSCVGQVTRNASQTAPQQPKNANSADFQMVAVAEEAAMVTNLLNTAGVSSYHINTPQNNQPAVTFTMVDGTNGFFLASRGKDTVQADEYASSVIGTYSKLCKGNFMSGKKSLSTDDGSVVRRLLMSCQNQDGTFAADTTILRRADGFLMELTQSYSRLISEAAEPTPNRDREALVSVVMHLPAN